jgi:hypothetical protein
MYIVYAYKALVTWNRNKVGQRHQVWSYTWVARAQSWDARQLGYTLRVHLNRVLETPSLDSLSLLALQNCYTVPHVHRRSLVWSPCLLSFLLFVRSDSFRYSLRSTVLSYIMTAQLQTKILKSWSTSGWIKGLRTLALPVRLVTQKRIWRSKKLVNKAALESFGEDSS